MARLKVKPNRSSGEITGLAACAVTTFSIAYLKAWLLKSSRFMLFVYVFPMRPSTVRQYRYYTGYLIHEYKLGW